MQHFVRRRSCWSLCAIVIANLLALPASGGSFATPLQAPVAEAAGCPPTLSDGAGRIPGRQRDYVMYLQALLNDNLRVWGHQFAEDGVFGADTVGAVKEFQGHTRLEQDGIVGPKTWHKLGAC